MDGETSGGEMVTEKFITGFTGNYESWTIELKLRIVTFECNFKTKRHFPNQWSAQNNNPQSPRHCTLFSFCKLSVILYIYISKLFFLSMKNAIFKNDFWIIDFENFKEFYQNYTFEEIMTKHTKILNLFIWYYNYWIKRSMKVERI